MGNPIKPRTPRNHADKPSSRRSKPTSPRNSGEGRENPRDVDVAEDTAAARRAAEPRPITRAKTRGLLRRPMKIAATATAIQRRADPPSSQRVMLGPLWAHFPALSHRASPALPKDAA